MVKRLSFVFIILFFIAVIIAPQQVKAAKKFVPKKGIVKKVVSGSIPAVVRYRGDRLGILFSFLNFNGMESVSYAFTYTTSGNPQGAGGTITAANDPTKQRELLFGTCSTSVCTYHYNLANARLVLTAKMTNGKTVSKSYRIKTYQ
jgi:hypothetical protein